MSTTTPSTDPVWTDVDKYTFQHSHPASRPNTEALQSTLSASEAAGLPNIALSPAQAKFLALHCRASGVTHALEVGTLAGYSAIWLASENPELRVTSIESDGERVELARANVERAGLSDRIEIIHGAGLEVLKRLREEVLEAGTRPRFGFAFIDADKVNNWNYFQMARDMALPRSVICVDNVVRYGRVADLNNSEPYVLGSREVIEKAGEEPGVDSVVMQLVGEKSYDGWLWAVVS